MVPTGSWSAVSISGACAPQFGRAIEREWGDGAAWSPQYKTQAFNRRSRKWRDVLRPILPGYVLVRLPHLVSDALLTIYARGERANLLRDSDGYPLHVSARDAEQLARIEREGPPGLPGDPRVYALQFKSGGIYVVEQGVLAGVSVECIRSGQVGDTTGSFTVGMFPTRLPLYLFEKTV